jgi:hypothetical protein
MTNFDFWNGQPQGCTLEGLRLDTDLPCLPDDFLNRDNRNQSWGNHANGSSSQRFGGVV